jgi:hypothetical protein
VPLSTLIELLHISGLSTKSFHDYLRSWNNNAKQPGRNTPAFFIFGSKNYKYIYNVRQQNRKQDKKTPLF